ncbi:MAG TPA: hypothetical protein VHG51_05385, partial [Longimicrobiaceae bacterium]|nr:hypothetical protein [Longimicrobiaceae bacterium]
ALGFDAPVEGLVFSLSTIAICVPIGVLVTVVAALAPAVRASRVAPVEALRAAKEQLRRVPRQGIGWGLLRHTGGDAELALAPRPQLAFNYLGRFDAAQGDDALFRITRDPAGPARAAANPRTHLLEVNAAVAGDELVVGWTYGAELHREETVRALAERHLEAVRALVEHCRTADAGGYSPSDFPSVRLSQKSLDRLMGKLARVGA